jgi:hypothetical protein
MMHFQENRVGHAAMHTPRKYAEWIQSVLRPRSKCVRKYRGCRDFTLALTQQKNTGGNNRARDSHDDDDVAAGAGDER